MDDKIKLIISEFAEERIKKDELLKYHTLSKLGGPAEYFFIATNQSELIKILNLTYELKIPYFIFGAGTKILFSDKDIKGLVIKNRTGAVKIGGIKGKVGREGLGVEEAVVDVDSGVSLGKLNDFLSRQRLKELKGFSSTQATVGGAIFLDPALQNAALKIKVWDRGITEEINMFALKRDQHVVLSVLLKVKAG